MTTPTPPGSLPPDTIQRYLEAHCLQLHVPTREEIEGLLRLAGISASDAGQPGLSANGVLQFAYQAQMQATMALLRAYGYRTVTSDKAHHFRLIDAVRVLAKADGEQELADAMIALDHLRSSRANSVYEQDIVAAEDAAEALGATRRLMPAVQRILQPRLATIPSQRPINQIGLPGLRAQ